MTVTPISQRDRKWASVKLGTSASTIGGEGCALMCVSMLLNYLTPDLPAIDPLALNALFIRHKGYRLGNLINWPALPSLFPQLAYKNRTDCPHSPAPVDKISAWLQRLPLIAYVDFYGQNDEFKGQNGFKQHFVLLLEPEPPDNAAIADPWTGEITTLCPRYGRTPAEAICGVIWMDRP